MPLTKPYQPLILRLLHSITALLVISAAITGFLVYDSWDGRFGRLLITLKNRELIDIHGTFAFFLLPLLILLTIYSIRVGYRRLIQADSFSKLKEVGQPIWWYTLQRFANSFMLISALFALLSGKFQDENWLPQGQLNQPWYYVHLLAWCGVVVALGLHLLMSVKIGGIPLLVSMFDTKISPDDSPKLWLEQVKNWLRNPHL